MKRARWLCLWPALAALWAQESTPPPVAEDTWQGSVDVRNRFVQDVGGNSEVYRSLVNLGEGPKLFEGELRYSRPGSDTLDELTLSGASWGGDPYNTARLDAKSRDVYELRLNYRNTAYFNNLPSFANPLLGEGLLLSQRALDVTRRQLDTELIVKPNSLLSPFFSLYHAEGFGRGVTTYVTDGNEFPISTNLDDGLTSFRGGLKLNFARFNVTLEQGGTTFDDRQRVFFNSGGNRGNRRTSLLGRTLLLDELEQLYSADGSGLFNRGVVQGRPWDFLHFTGQFLYSQPKVNVTQDLGASGSFLSQALLIPFTGQTERSIGDANRPHSAGSWSTEIRPHQRLRVVQSWFTDRYHISSGATVAQLLNTDPETLFQQDAIRTLVFNYNQHQVDVIFDIHSRVSLRGGHRYIWGDAEVPAATLQFGREPRTQGETRRHVGLAGASVRAARRLRVTFDFEASPGGRTFFRTGLMDYQKAKFRARYKFSKELSMAGSFSVLDNRNDAPDVGFDFESWQTSLSLHWTPEKLPFNLLADYARSTINSDIQAVSLPFFGTQIAHYRDDAHLGGLHAEIELPRDARVTFGGSVSTNSGSRPANFYQPRALIAVPILDRVKWVAEWRWYGFSEDFLAIENFRTHTFSAGLQFGM